MRRNIRDIEIQEPPLQEIGGGHSCFKRSCLSGCGCIVFLLIALVVLSQLALRQHTKELKSLPDDFPKSMPVYDTDAINSISYASKDDQNLIAKAVYKLPKLIIAPIVRAIRAQTTSTDPVIWDKILSDLENPKVQLYNTINLEWNGLTAQPDFIDEYYRNELLKKSFAIHETAPRSTTRQFSFTSTTINGALYIQDNPAEAGTDDVKLTIKYSN